VFECLVWRFLCEVRIRATPGFAVEKRSSGTFRFERESSREAKTLGHIAKASSAPGIAYQSALRKNSRALCRLIRALPGCDCAVGVGTYNERGIHVSDTLSCSLIWTDLGAHRAVAVRESIACMASARAREYDVRPKIEGWK
jgi:hypothetical protein